MGLWLSPGICDGGVKRFERLLTFAEAVGGWLLMVEYGRYLEGSVCGGGNSKLGKLLAAGLRAVRLDPAPPGGSAVELIPDGGSAPLATVKGLSRLWLSGLNTSDSVVGGVGSVFEGGPPTAPLDALAPGQYPAPTWEFEKSREGNFNRNAEDGRGASNERGVVARAEMMLGEGTSSRAGDSERAAVLITMGFCRRMPFGGGNFLGFVLWPVLFFIYLFFFLVGSTKEIAGQGEELRHSSFFDLAVRDTGFPSELWKGRSNTGSVADVYSMSPGFRYWLI